MKILSWLLVLVFLSPLSALETDPNKMKLLQCMALYEFDFVADELGFAIHQVDGEGKEVPPPDEREAAKIRVEQGTKFLATGKLTVRPSIRGRQNKIEKPMVVRCQTIAEAVMEAMYLKGELAPDGEGDKFKIRPLEQSL